MYSLYGSISLTNEDIVLLRQPLKQKLDSLATFDTHVTKCRHAFSKLDRVGQGVPKLEAFNLFSASISHHLILHNPIQFYHAQHPTILSHDWLLLSTHISPQIPFLVSSAPTSPFAGLAGGIKQPKSSGKGRRAPPTAHQTDLLTRLNVWGGGSDIR